MKPHIEQSSAAPANIQVTVSNPSALRRAGTVLGLTGVVLVGANFVGGDIIDQKIDQQESEVAVTWEKLAPIDVQCFVAGEAEVESSVRTKLSVLGKEAGPTGYKAAMSADAEPHVCFDGAFMSMELDEDTGKQTVTINRAGQKILTEYGRLNLETDVEGYFAEMGDALFTLGDAIGIDGPKDKVNKEKAKLGEVLENATKNALETHCINQLGDDLDRLLVDGLHLQAKNRGIEVSSIEVNYVGDVPAPTPVDFGTEAGRLGFRVSGDPIKNISCQTNPGTFENIDELVKQVEPADALGYKNVGEK